MCFVDRSDVSAAPLAWAVVVDTTGHPPVGVTGDPAWAYDVELAAGQGTTPHEHPTHDVVMMVVEGEIEHRTADRTVRVGAGNAVFVERATSHSTRAPSVPARILVMLGSLEANRAD